MDQSKCRRCHYRFFVDAEQDGELMAACVYVLWGKGRRPCPPGEECTVFEERMATDALRDIW